MAVSDNLVAVIPSGRIEPARQDADVMISVRNVGKMYRLYERPQDRLRQQLFWRFGKYYGREFWALRDISFEVRRGESVGIIGRNGSGKSTLLQIITGTLAPTTGAVQVGGRMAALLELGSGFNPNFTGRENVLMNGAILGMSEQEMEERFDEIAAFADIGEFMDQPVKLYSSGMAVRLAFSVQAVVEKEVLIVDEALAVGDEAFQRKCLRKLEEFRASGGTVLLVSHSAQAIVRQCSRCLFLHAGQLVLDGPSKPVTDIYQRFLYGTPQQQRETLDLVRGNTTLPTSALLAMLPKVGDGYRGASADSVQAAYDPNLPQTEQLTYGSGEAEIFDWGMYDDHERAVNVLVSGETYKWRYYVRFHESVTNVNFGMMFKLVDGLQVAAINAEHLGVYFDAFQKGQVVEVSFCLYMSLAPGTYYLNSGVTGKASAGTGEGNFLHRRVDMCVIRVVAPDSRGIHGVAYLEPSLEVRPL